MDVLTGVPAGKMHRRWPGEEKRFIEEFDLLDKFLSDPRTSSVYSTNPQAVLDSLKRKTERIENLPLVWLWAP